MAQPGADTRPSPRRIPRGTALMAIMSLLGAGLSVGVWAFLSSMEDRSNRRAFEAQAVKQVQAIANEFDRTVDAVVSVRALYAASQEVDHHEFARFGEAILAQHPSLRSLMFVPRVDDADPMAFERGLAAQAGEPATITERNADDQRVRAAHRDDYFPVGFAVPTDFEDRMRGYDLAAIPERRAAFMRAIQLDRPTTTECIRLKQGGRRQHSVLVVLPVFANDRPIQAPEQRDENLDGWSVGVFRVAQLIESAVSTLPVVEGHLTVTDLDAPHAPQPIYTRGEAAEGRINAVSARHDLHIAGRNWLIECSAPQSFLVDQRSPLPTTAMVFGLVLTGFTSRYFWTLARHNARFGVEIADRQAAEAKYRDLYEHAPDMYVSVDAQTGQVLECNRALSRELGYPRGQVIGRPLMDLYAPSDRESARRVFERFQEQGRIVNEELRLRRADGTELDVSLSVTAVKDSTGRIVRTRSVWRNITELKAARAQLEAHADQLETQVEQRTAQLRDANREPELKNRRLADLTETAHRFVDNVAHEFRTPLTVIQEFASILEDGIGGPVSDDQLEYLGFIAGSTRDLAQMVDDFLDSSKLRAGALRVDRRAHRVTELLDKARPILHQRAASRSIVIDEQIAPDLEPICCDLEKAVRVVVNLTVNAIKFSPVGATVCLRARRGEEGEVWIDVIDRGPGIEPDELAVVCERFRQVGDPQRTSTKGFGLGLNIAKELVWLNLGRMDISSRVGHGSTFSFCLPTHQPTALVAHYVRHMREAEPETGFAVLAGQTSDAEAANRWRERISGATRPTDLVMCADDGLTLLVIGATGDAGGWQRRIEQAVADGDDDAPGGVLALVDFVVGHDAERTLAAVAQRYQAGTGREVTCHA